jgi:hypothetical protein
VYFAWTNRAKFLNAISIPTLSLVVVWGVWLYFSDAFPLLFSWVILLAYGLSFSFFAVTCHRLILVDDVERNKSFNAKPGYRELRFLAWLIVIFAIKSVLDFAAQIFVQYVGSSVLAEVAGSNSDWIMQVASIPALYVLARFSLAFPATAIDKRSSLRWAWTRTHGQGWRIFVIVGLFPWFFGMVLWFVWREEATLVEQVVLSILAYVGLAIEIVALSFTYKELAKHFATAAQPVSGEYMSSLTVASLDAFHDLPQDGNSRKIDVGMKVVLGFVLIYLLIGTLISQFTDCSSELIAGATSPGGAYKAELINRTCEDANSHGVIMSITKTTSPKTSYSYTLSKALSNQVDFVWTSDKGLTVRHAGSLDLADMPSKIDDVQIIYEKRY